MTHPSLLSVTSTCYHDSFRFVNRCIEKFQWQDLSKDVIMDIGCGHELNCCIAILDQFPDVRELIAVDKDSTVFQKAHTRERRIRFCVGDIQERDSLKSYEGKMDKVISTNTFDEIIDKEMSFRNAYRLLKPGGEAGFYFCVNTYMHKFLSVLSEIPKYAAIIEDKYAKNLNPPEHGKQYYKELLEKIGFKQVLAFDNEKRVLFPSDQSFKDDFLEHLKTYLKLSPEATETSEAEVVELYEKVFGRTDGKLLYVSAQLNLLGVKPVET
ncbi:jhamt [Trichonephila clavata]|uniref:Jhamt n=1 Tax=Trichonephila clavata TaxID=2740835 RepID=A0A8X6HDE4_TRICU|nr:jhamt [Trichonephila clavata]